MGCTKWLMAYEVNKENQISYNDIQVGNIIRYNCKVGIPIEKY